jgi:hypothetical protein
MFTRIAVVGAISAGMTLNLNRRKAYCSPVPAGGYPFDTRVSETFARSINSFTHVTHFYLGFSKSAS